MFNKFWQSYGPLHLEFFTHFSLSSQLLLHCCMDLNDSWQGCCVVNKYHIYELRIIYYYVQFINDDD